MAISVRQNLADIGQAWKANLAAMVGYGLLAVVVEAVASLVLGEPLIQDVRAETGPNLPMKGVGVVISTALLLLFAPRVLPSIKTVPWNRFLPVLVIEVVVSLAVSVGLVLLVIPGIIAAIIFAAASPLALNRGMDQALTQSVQLGWARASWVLGTALLMVLALLGFGLVFIVLAFTIGSDHPATLLGALPMAIVAGPGLTIAQLVTARNLEGVRVAPDVITAFD